MFGFLLDLIVAVLFIFPAGVEIWYRMSTIVFVGVAVS
jgi:hypothetical protein